MDSSSRWRCASARLRDLSPAALSVFVSCTGAQSALAPAGRGAERIATLFWVMLGVGLVIWVAVVCLGLYALRQRPQARDPRPAQRLIVWGGAIVPTALLTVLLGYGLWMLPGLLASPGPGSLRIQVVAEQFWWRVRYPVQGGSHIELANEVHLPRGEPVEFVISTPDVIHAFWIPALGGKVDAIPGRTTRLTLEPTHEGTFRGACAEYCGTSHAWMGLVAIVESRAEFERFLVREREPARRPSSELSLRGQVQFGALGCGACHTLRGTNHRGQAGPDLTHIGARSFLGAATLPNDRKGLARWLTDTHTLKPGVRMPSFGMVDEASIQALSAYLESLR